MEEELDSEDWKSRFDLCEYTFTRDVSNIPTHDEVVLLTKDTLRKHTYHMTHCINGDIVLLANKKNKRIYKYIDKYHFYHRKPLMDKENGSNYLKKLIDTDFKEIVEKMNRASSSSDTVPL
jgi:hypothetical protein